MLEAAHDLHQGPHETHELRRGRIGPRESAMRQGTRQVGVVIGLTVILTFPVTVVSGAGSQKHSDHLVRTSPSQWTTAAQAKRVLDPGSDSEVGGPTPRR